MPSEVHTIIFPASDIEKSKALFSALLGVEPYVDAPYYVGFRVGDVETGLNPRGHQQGMTGGVCYYEVTDIKAAISDLEGLGAASLQDVTDVGGGKLIATVKDADGNVIGLTQNPVE